MADITIDELCPRAAVPSARSGGMVAEDAWASYDRGIAWAQIGAYEQALEAWREALRLKPEMAEAHAAAGDAYMALGCWNEAIRSYEHAIQAGPTLIAGYYGLGAAHGRLGDYDRAIAVYDQAMHLLSHDPAPPQAIVTEIDAPDQNLFPAESQTDRVRAGTTGFDFSALLSSPDERRQAVRQEPATVAPVPAVEAHYAPAEHMFRQEPASSLAPDSAMIAATAPDLQTAEAEATGEEGEDETYIAPVRDRRAGMALAVALTILGCMGGNAAVKAINEAHDREAYLAATRAAQMHRSMPASSVSSTPTRVQE